MSDKTVRLLLEFKRALVMFLDELVETFPNEPDFVTLRILVNDQIPAQMIMDAFIEDLEHVRQQALERDERFFTESNPIFRKLDRVEQFRRVWVQSEQFPENRETMWAWFSLFVKFAEKFASA